MHTRGVDQQSVQWLTSRMEELLVSMERMGLAEYVEMMHRPGRVIYTNLLAGLARGVGMAIGFALLGALLIYILRWIVLLNLPLISNFIADLIQMVQYQMGVS